MSDSNGPVRRRRIAGESKPAATAGKAPAKKTVRKPVGRPAPRTGDAGRPAKQPAVAKVAPKRTTAMPPGTVRPVRTPPVVPTQAAGKPAAAFAAATDERDGPTRQDLRWLVPAVLVTVASLVLGAVLLARGISDAREGSDLAASQRQAASAGGTAAETIFSFRHDELDEHLSSSKAIMTPRFGKEFDKIAPALTQLAPQRKIVVKAVTRNAAVVSCGDECSSDKAKVLVFVDQARLVGNSKKPTVFANRVSVSVVKTGDGWLVDDIRAL